MRNSSSGTLDTITKLLDLCKEYLGAISLSWNILFLATVAYCIIQISQQKDSVLVQDSVRLQPLLSAPSGYKEFHHFRVFGTQEFCSRLSSAYLLQFHACDGEGRIFTSCREISFIKMLVSWRQGRATYQPNHRESKKKSRKYTCYGWNGVTLIQLCNTNGKLCFVLCWVWNQAFFALGARERSTFSLLK